MNVVTLEILALLALWLHLTGSGRKHMVEVLYKAPVLPPKRPIYTHGDPFLLSFCMCESQLIIHGIGTCKTVILLPLLLHISSSLPSNKSDIKQGTIVVLKQHLTIWSVN